MGLVRMAARTAVVAGTATAVSGRVQRRQAAKYDQQDAQQYAEQAPPPPAAAPQDDANAQLQNLAQLHAQGVLTDEEFALVKTHTAIGARILSGSRFSLLRLAEEIAFSHHEHWDGGGYEGLVGEAIPLAGRIVADDADADLGVTEVGGELDAGHAHHAHPRILDATQDLRQRLLDSIGDPFAALHRHAHHLPPHGPPHPTAALPGAARAAASATPDNA